jgi:uncharacterized membrane protein YgdD (TMEM256/DUF423 family)
MHKGFVRIAALLGALTVGIGAFGAHALKQKVTADALATFETGVRYQFYHVIALLAVAILYAQGRQQYLKWAGNCFIVGILLFSGSLYWITWSKTGAVVGIKGIGMVAPFGGLFFIGGWMLLFLAFTQKNITVR